MTDVTRESLRATYRWTFPAVMTLTVHSEDFYYAALDEDQLFVSALVAVQELYRAGSWPYRGPASIESWEQNVAAAELDNQRPDFPEDMGGLPGSMKKRGAESWQIYRSTERQQRMAVREWQAVRRAVEGDSAAALWALYSKSGHSDDDFVSVEPLLGLPPVSTWRREGLR